MPRRSAGLLIHRLGSCGLEVLLVHPGGPFWRGRDIGTWQIPEGEIESDEDPQTAARREAEEELGVIVDLPLQPLGEARQAGGKHVVGFAAEMDVDVAAIVSNTIEIVWPPRSGRRISIPEIDEARWMSVPDARRLMLPSQLPFIDRLEGSLAEPCLDNARFDGERVGLVDHDEERS